MPLANPQQRKKAKPNLNASTPKSDSTERDDKTAKSTADDPADSEPPIRPFALRKKANTVDYSIVGGKWGTPVTSRNAQSFLHPKASDVNEEPPERKKANPKACRSDENGSRVGHGVSEHPASTQGDKIGEHTYFEEWMTPERRDGRDGGNGGRAHKKGSLEKGEKGQNKRDDELKGASKGGQEALRLSRRVKGRLSRIRYLQAFLDAYEEDGWGGSGHRKLKPTQELDKSSQQILDCKKAIRDDLRKMDPAQSLLDPSEIRMREEDFEEAGIDLDKVVCAVCGSGDAVAGNDILMCDFRNCYRAYHQCCHHPRITKLPDEDEDWTCSQCSNFCDCLEEVNECFGTHHSSWEKMFPELGEAPEEGDVLEDEEYDSQEDDDYQPLTPAASDDNASVHTESADSSSSSGDDGDAESGSEEDQEEDAKEEGEGGEGEKRTWKNGAKSNVLAGLLMGSRTPPDSPRAKKRKRKGESAVGKGAKGKGKREDEGDEEQVDSDAAKARKMMLADFYGSWHPEFGPMTESGDDDYDPNNSSDQGERDDPEKNPRSPKSPKAGKGKAVVPAASGRSQRQSAAKALQYFATLPE